MHVIEIKKHSYKTFNYPNLLALYNWMDENNITHVLTENKLIYEADFKKHQLLWNFKNNRLVIFNYKIWAK